MLFRCTSEVAENELYKYEYKKLIPIYKSLCDNLTDEVTWIHNKANLIVDSACEHVWDLYYDDFIDKKILSKHNFYRLIREELKVKMKVVKISQNATKNCFIK